MDSPEAAVLAAASRCDVQTLTAIITEVDGIDVNCTDETGKTPLMLCTCAKRVKTAVQMQCIRQLLESGAYLDSADVQLWRTAAHWAVQNKAHEVLAELLTAGANVKCLDRQELSIVHMAVECGAVACIKTMASCLPRGVLDEEDTQGLTALVRATRLGDVAVVKQLLASGASPSLATSAEEHRNAVHWAAVCGQAKILAMMLKAGGDARSVDKNQWTVAHLAAISPETGCLEVLLKQSSELVFEVADQDALTPLMLACQYGNVAHVRLLLKRKVSVLAADQAGRNALHHCIFAPNAKCVPVLVKHESKLLSRKDAEGKSPLQLAVQEGSALVVDALLQCGDRVDVVDGESHSLVHWATVKGQAHVIQVLANHSARLSTADTNGAHPVHYAAQMSATLPPEPDDVLQETVQGPRMQECLRTLLQLQAGVNVQDLEGRTPLHWAAGRHGNTTAVEMLVKHGADVNAVDKQLLSPLHIAASSGVFDMCHLLVTQLNAEVDKMDENGRTPLFYAVVTGNQDIAEELIDYGAIMEHLDNEGMTVAHCAAAVGLISFLELLQTEAPHLLNRASFIGKTPLHEAAVSGQSQCLEYLISAGCPAYSSLVDGTTPLHLAAEAGHYDGVVQLLEARAPVNCISVTEDFDYLTPLDCAMLQTEDDTCKELLLVQGACSADDIIIPAVVTIQRFARGMNARRRIMARCTTPALTRSRADAGSPQSQRAEGLTVASTGGDPGSGGGYPTTPATVPEYLQEVDTANHGVAETTRSEHASSMDTLPLPSDDLLSSMDDHEEDDRINGREVTSHAEELAMVHARTPATVQTVRMSTRKTNAGAPDVHAAEPLEEEVTAGISQAQPRAEHTGRERVEEELVEELVFSTIPPFEEDNVTGHGNQKEKTSEVESNEDAIRHASRAESPADAERSSSSLQETTPHDDAVAPEPAPWHNDDPVKKDMNISDHIPPKHKPTSSTLPKKISENPFQSAGQRVRTFLSRTSNIMHPLAQYRANKRKSQQPMTTLLPAQQASATSVAFLCAQTTATACSIVGEHVGLLALHTAQAIAVGTLEELLERQRVEALNPGITEADGADDDGSCSGDENGSIDVVASDDTAAAETADAGKAALQHAPDSSPSAEDVFRALEASRGPTLATQATQELMKTLKLQVKLQQEIVEAELESSRQQLLKEETLRRQQEAEAVAKDRQALERNLKRAATVADRTSCEMSNAVKGAQKHNKLMGKQLGAVGSPKQPTVAQWLQAKEKQRQAKAQAELLAWDTQQQQRDTMLGVQNLLMEERRQRHLGWEKIKSLRADVRWEGKRIQDTQYHSSPEYEFAQMSLSPRKPSRHSTTSSTHQHSRAASAGVSYSAPRLPRVQPRRSLTGQYGKPVAPKKDLVMSKQGFVKLPVAPPYSKPATQRSPRRGTTEQYGAEDLWELASKVASGKANAPAVVDGRALYPRKPATRHAGHRTLTFLPPDEYDQLQHERQQKEMLLEMQRTRPFPPRTSRRGNAAFRTPWSPVKSRAGYSRNDGTVTIMSKVAIDTESQLSV